MNPATKARLARAGFTTGDAAGFLHLTPEEARFVELKLALANGLRQLREKRQLTQSGLARLLHSSQSRVAKMEAADRSVSLDLLLRSLLALGASPADIAGLIRRAGSKRAA